MAKRFRVLLHGDNFVLALDDEGLSKVNFYATRFVDAPDSQAAQALAIDKLWSDQKLLARRNSDDDLANIRVVEIEEVKWYAKRLLPMRGFTFYADTSEPSSTADELVNGTNNSTPRELAYQVEKEASVASFF